MLIRPLAAGVLAALAAAACSGQADAPGASGQVARWLGGFRLGEAERAVAARAERDGLLGECHGDGLFDRFCRQSMDGPAREPSLSFGFKDGRLVSVSRTLGRNRTPVASDEIVRDFTRAYGAPVVDGLANDFVTVKVWTIPDTAEMAVLTCGVPSARGECDLGVDAAAGRSVSPMIAYWRGAVARQARWRVLQRTERGAMAFDTQSLVDRGGVRGVWVRGRLLIPPAREPGRNADQTRTYLELDCAGRRYRGVEEIDYLEEAEIARRRLPAEWTAVSPGQVQETIFRAVCAYRPQRKE